MDSRVEKALSNFKKSYNCAQAVACAYSDLFGLEESLAFRMSEGFGGGMGGTHSGTCGAVTAMYLLAGIQNSSGGVENGLTKASTYATVRELGQMFREKNGSTICSDLLGMNDPATKHSCDACIKDAALLIEQVLLDEDA